MRVYIEYVIVDNMVIDCLLLWLSAVTLKIKPDRVRIFLASVIGTAGAIALSADIPLLLGFVLKIVLGFVMTAVACSDKRLTIRYYLIFAAYTFIMGGAVLGVLFMLQAKVYDALTLNYASGIPVGLIVGCIAAVVLLAVKAVKTVYARRFEIGKGLAEVVLFIDREYKLKGLLDSGNLLTYEGKPVYFAVSRRLKAVIVGRYAENLLKMGEGNARIPFSTVGGSSECLAVKPDRLTVNGKERDCYVAFGKVESQDFDIII